MPKGKTPLRSQRQRSSPVIPKTPGWTAASCELFAEPLQTPSPFKNRVLTRRTSVYVQNIHKARALIDGSQEMGVQKVSRKEKAATRNTRKQTTSKKYTEDTKSRAKSATELSSRSKASVTSTKSAVQQRASKPPAPVKDTTSPIENAKNKRRAPRSKSPARSKVTATTAVKSRSRVETKSIEMESTKSPKQVKSKSPNTSPERSASESPVRSQRVKKSTESSLKVPQDAKKSVTENKTPARKASSKSTVTSQKKVAATVEQTGSETPKGKLPSTPLMKESKTETFSTPMGSGFGLKSSKASVMVTSRTPLGASPQLVRKTVRITESEHRTPRTPIHRQATPGRLNTQSRIDGATNANDSSALLVSVTKKRKMTVVTGDSHNITPIKAAKVLGKVVTMGSGTKRLPKKPKKSQSPQHTSTPASRAASKRSMVAPPVSEIRRSKRLKPEQVEEEGGLRAVDATLEACLNNPTTPEKQREAIEAMDASQHAVVANRESWWGYCNIL